MSIRYAVANIVSKVLTWGLHSVAKRPGATLPGTVACKIDPAILQHARGKIRDGCIITVGTNGKTTVNNLLADTLEGSGRSVICNRTGANMVGGITSALLQSKPADWGVLECDELWLSKVLPLLQADYVLLLNLFRDQLDRCGEIDRIQDSIVEGLAASPRTVLIYNADDPLCAMVAKRAAEREGGGSTTFGISQDMGLAQNVVADATMCQVCSHMFEYEYRQYGQLGAYLCPHCGFKRPDLDYAAENIHLEADHLDLEVVENADGRLDDARYPHHTFTLSTALSGSYMVYNLLGVATAARMIGCAALDIQKAVTAFNPKNGRLQEYRIDGRRTLLNLAKNPTGFNQNLRIVNADQAPHAVAFFINDKVVDGHDISWIWDIDFEELADKRDVLVYAGGIRKNDLQVRLKYAGISARLVNSIDDVYRDIEGKLPDDAAVYAIANYTALPDVKARLDALEEDETALKGKEKKALQDASEEGAVQDPISAPMPGRDSEPVVIAHMLPDLLNLYGDGGNVRILKKRLEWRGIPVEVRAVNYGEEIDLNEVDLLFLGGGPDREQKLASEQLHELRDQLASYVEDDGAVLAICGGYQILGKVWLLGDDEVPGLGILDMETRRPGTSADRLVDNIALSNDLTSYPIIGYENHAGRTYLGSGLKPFGRVISKVGFGNTDTGEGSFADGVIHRSLIGTYLHGPLLSKNPAVADWLLERALEHRAKRTGSTKVIELRELDDGEEYDANWYMTQELTQ